MRKTTILLLIFLVCSVKGYSQLAVTDPGVTAATTTGNSIQTVSQTIQKIMASAQLSLLDPKIFDDITTVMEILEYLDQLACQTTELKFNFKYAKNYSCLTMLNMKDITMNLNYSSQLISKLFKATDIVSLSKEGRISTLSDILTKLKAVSAQLGETNLALEGYLSRRIAKDYIKKVEYQTRSQSVGDRYR